MENKNLTAEYAVKIIGTCFSGTMHDIGVISVIRGWIKNTIQTGGKYTKSMGAQKILMREITTGVWELK